MECQYTRCLAANQGETARYFVSSLGLSRDDTSSANTIQKKQIGVQSVFQAVSLLDMSL